MPMAGGSSTRRLTQVLRQVSNSKRAYIGSVQLGDLTYDVPKSRCPSRLPLLRNQLDIKDAFNADNLHFMLQKYLLGQDIFLYSQPGPYARHLAMTFCSLVNMEYEYVALHRDIGETELKQGREMQPGGSLTYIDSAAVRAVKHGRILILEGVEKAERGIMPLLNNLLENREMNLDDGTHILHPHRYALLDGNEMEHTQNVFLPVHEDFIIIAIAAPVPPFPGYPLDPPFRSRFQARFIDPVGSMRSLANIIPTIELSEPSRKLRNQIEELILTVQIASEAKQPTGTSSRNNLPAFPQSALRTATQIIRAFPPPDQLTPDHLAKLMVILNPALIVRPPQVWEALSQLAESAGLGPLGDHAKAGCADGSGIMGYRILDIQRVGESLVQLIYERGDGYRDSSDTIIGTRFLSILNCLLQAHALGRDISLIPPALPSTASCSTSTLIRAFASTLGYDLENVHIFKELGGRELIMRRKVEDDGSTTWKASPLIQAAWSGELVNLAGLDSIGPTAGSIARIMQDREAELWGENRIVASTREMQDMTEVPQELTEMAPGFRAIATASKALPLKDWLSEEHCNMFFAVPSYPMDKAEEMNLLHRIGCPPSAAEKLVSFAENYRSIMTSESVQKNRKFGTRSLIRIARRLAKYPWDDDLHAIISRTVLAEFLPAAEKMTLGTIFSECDIPKRTELYNPPAIVEPEGLLFPAASDSDHRTQSVEIPLFNKLHDLEGFSSFVPSMEHFFDNSLQTGHMRDMATDMEIFGEHLVLLGNQGVGKNKIIDRLCQLLRRPREYIQLHRDTTVNQLMFQTTLDGGVLRYQDSPLLRGIKHGRIVVIDEADKAPEHVVAIFKSLAGHGEMTLLDGRRVRRVATRETDIAVHPNFRLVLLANRPGYPFLGNHFLQVLGDNFSCHAVSNPDEYSEKRLLKQLAPELDPNLISRLVGVFQSLRQGYETGQLNYPYSLRELINLVRHLRAYPDDSLETALRNIFDFDVHKQESLAYLERVLVAHGFEVRRLGFDAAREVPKKSLDVKFEPKGSKDLSAPKFGKEDPENKEHHGGNTWAGGTGGRDTAGLGGRGGYMRLFKGHQIKQVSEALKNDVPDHIREQAREMARKELAKRLQELNMSMREAKGYGELLSAVEPHVARLFDVLENLSAREEERVWIKRQIDGELDDTRLTEGLTGESTVYKRRGFQKPEFGRPQIKPKRIRFVFDVSGSMYRFQYDGRLQRSLETAVMIMEVMNQITRKDKYVWDMYGHSGDEPAIPLVEAEKTPDDLRERWKVVEKMGMITQYTFAGDHTVEAIKKAVDDVAKYDGDDYFVIAISDANFARYNITLDDLKRAMDGNPKVHTALICIGDGTEATWIPRNFPGRGFKVTNANDIPVVLRNIFTTMIDR